MTTPPYAIIAGAGRFPWHVAQEAKRQGLPVIAVGIRGWADPSLATMVDAYAEMGVGELGRLVTHLKQHGVRQAIMAGKVTKEVLLDHRTQLDAETQRLLLQLRDFSVSSVLGAIAERLARDGVTLLDSSTFLRDHLCPDGVLTARRLTPAEQEDLELGLQVARTIAGLDVGQTVAVKQRVVVAVEALEGTDAAIRRAHALAGEGLVVVKAASPTQDRRFDLPIVGADTIAILAEARAACLAVEAGATLLLEREAVIRQADAANLCLIGVRPGDSAGPSR